MTSTTGQFEHAAQAQAGISGTTVVGLEPYERSQRSDHNGSEQNSSLHCALTDMLRGMEIDGQQPTGAGQPLSSLCATGHSRNSIPAASKRKVHYTFERRDPETGYPHPPIPNSLRHAAHVPPARFNSEGKSPRLSIPHRFTIVLVLAFLVPLIVAAIMAQ